jgi:PAS domain S-box-containing protein
MADTDVFRALLDAAPDAIVAVDARGVITLVNAQAEALFGYVRDDLLGKPVELLVPDAVRAVHPRHRTSYFAHPVTRPMGAGTELAGRRRDGSAFPAEDTITVLVADGEAAHRSAVKRILERSGHFTVVAEAGDGQEAVRLAGAVHPDLVVLDLSMPKMDGLDALPRILASCPETKVALLSGHVGGAPLAAGASLQLRKGVKPAQLVEDLLLVMGVES